MIGYLLYEKTDAIRNQGFIEELKSEAEQLNVNLQLVHSVDQIQDHVEFVIYRGRNYQIVQRLEEKGIRVFNRSEVNRIANNKLSTFELAVMLGVPTIETHKLYTEKQVQQYPVVVKTIDGYGGTEVHLCHHISDIQRIKEMYSDRELIVQPYLESKSTDIRFYAIGDEIIGAVKRVGQETFKSNRGLGGLVERYQPSQYDTIQIQKITSALKSDYLGLDFLQLPTGHLVLNEIEDPVGARALYETHNFSVAHTFMQHVYKTMKKL